MLRALILISFFSCTHKIVNAPEKFVEEKTIRKAVKTAHPQPPILLPGLGSKLPSYNSQGYEDAVKKYADLFVVLRDLDKCGDDPLIGFNASAQSKNVSWCLQSNKTSKSLYVDLNANGKIDEKSLNLVDAADGFEANLLSSENTPIKFTLSSDGEVYLQDDNYRRGVLQLDESEMTFEIRGTSTEYGHPHQWVWFDLNGDNEIPPLSNQSEEWFQVRERYLNINESTWEFTIAKNGNTISLSPVAYRAPRSMIAVGHKAPNFSIDKTSKLELSDFRGDVILIDYWSQYCGFCVTAAPELKKLYDLFHIQGFQIVGLTDDPESEAQAFMKRHELDWNHVLESAEGPVNSIYRLDSYPSYILVDKKGTIRCLGKECLEKAKIKSLLEEE